MNKQIKDRPADTGKSRTSWKKRLSGLSKRLGLLGLSTFICLLLLEGALRVMIPTPGMPRELYNQHDEILGWEKQPNRRNHIKAARYSTTQIVNSEGFIGPEYPIEKMHDEYRILCLGDSYTEGYNVEFEDIFSEVLKRSLDGLTPDRRVEVINTGVGGYSTDQEYLVFEHKAKKYCPDLTVLMFYHNDVWLNARPTGFGGALKPYYKLTEDGQLELTNVPVPPVFLFGQTDGQHLSLSQRIVVRSKRWLSLNSRLYENVRQAVKQTPFLDNLVIRMGMGRKAADDTLLDTAAETGRTAVPDLYRVWEIDQKPEVDYAWAVTRALLGKLKTETSAIGSDFFVYYIPNREAIYPELWEKMREKYDMKEDEWDIEKCGRDLSRICDELGIAFFNSTEAYRAAATSFSEVDERLYGELDAHWNERGHYLAGEHLTENIYHSFLPGPHLSRTE